MPSWFFFVLATCFSRPQTSSASLYTPLWLAVVAIGFSTSKQQFRIHGGGGNNRNLVDRRRIVELLFEGRILEESSEGLKGGFVHGGRRVDQTEGPLILESLLALRGGEVQDEGQREGEQSECKGERRVSWFLKRHGLGESHVSSGQILLGFFGQDCSFFLVILSQL